MGGREGEGERVVRDVHRGWPDGGEGEGQTRGWGRREDARLGSCDRDRDRNRERDRDRERVSDRDRSTVKDRVRYRDKYADRDRGGARYGDRERDTDGARSSRERDRARH